MFRAVHAWSPNRWVMAGGMALAGMGWTPVVGQVPQAPPPARPAEHRPGSGSGGEIRPLGPQRYSIGDPTDEEQLYLEWINRARANPGAEGTRLASSSDPDVLAAYQYFNVQLGALTSELNAVAPTPPLAFHRLLIDAARWHTGDMFTNVFQGHGNSWDGGTAGSRLTAVGYPWAWVGENVYSYAKGVEHGHAGFEVDWGFGLYGMQGPPRGHRDNIHGVNFREIGVGVINGTNSRNGDEVGPQLVTQVFAAQGQPGPLVTGVAYYDVDGDGFYDVGEGLGGVKVDVVESTWHGITAVSGGYAVPVPGNGTYTVRFEGAGLATDQRTVTVSGGANIKVDFRPPYSPPRILGPILIPVARDTGFTVTEVGLATNYAWNVAAIVPWSGVEGAENGTNNFRVAVSPGYSVISTQTKYSGTRSFHLTTPEPETQLLELLREVRLGTNATLMFASRLGLAGTAQTARAEISVDGGGTWTSVWSRAGTGDTGQTAFELVNVPLGAHAGRLARVRFTYSVGAGSYTPSVSEEVGWYLDDIAFSQAVELTGTTRRVVSAPAFTFAPAAAGRYSLWAEAQVPGRWLPAGPEIVVEATTALPVADSIQWMVRTDGTLQLDCRVENSTADRVKLQRRTTLQSGWQTDNTLTPQTAAPDVYRFVVPLGPEPQMLLQILVEL